jgi:lipopolysaccharide/colanic/teichoic acid biosynthesis glycosyltransferase
LIILAIAIRLDSPGPAFLTQKRIGKKGRIFDFYKLRSMYQDTGCEDHREFARQYINGHHPTTEVKTEKLYKAGTDKQVTRIGRFLRKTSLDELPQLVNILKGDMSFVGPRPSIEYELEEYAQWHKKRLQVIPGLTGWAQIHGRSHLTFDEIVSLDLEYIKARSLRMDIYILLKTIPVVLSGRGAG